MATTSLRLLEDQPAVHVGPERQHLRVHAINVFVRDQDQSLRFYVDQLGFSLVGDVRVGSTERWVAVAPPDGSTVLSLVAAKPESKEYEFIGRHTHVVFIAEDVISKFQEWRSRGVKFSYTPRLKRMTYEAASPLTSGASPAPRVSGSHGNTTAAEHAAIWGGVITHFRDPDGNVFALVSYDEESRRVEAERRSSTLKIEAERRVAQELEIAKQVQTRLFPQRAPHLATLDYSGACLQAREVGGDYYDFLDLGRERLGLVVGDISGKGIAAALLMANLQASLRSQCAIASDQPQRFLQCVNQLFYENSADSAYATLFFAEYDDRMRRLRYANCGHLCGLLLRRDGGLDRLDSTCTVLGIFPEWECITGERPLCPGDTLALYTDGLTESFNDAGQEFGEERLAKSLRRHCGQPPSAMVASIVDDVQTFSPQEQYDDITLIVAKCR
jgi:serine phosphatase RsbU (regulator of sigma subunit)/catechol 2,3-dioxygenase-like lactoylglutathione lyase family enzyme